MLLMQLFIPKSKDIFIQCNNPDLIKVNFLYDATAYRTSHEYLMCPLNISAPSLEKNYPCTDQWILHRNSLLWPASVTSSLKRVPENSDLSTFSHLVSRQKMPPSIYQLLLILLWGRWTRKSTRVYYNTFEPYFASISFHRSVPFYLCFNSPKLQASETI